MSAEVGDQQLGKYTSRAQRSYTPSFEVGSAQAVDRHRQQRTLVSTG